MQEEKKKCKRCAERRKQNFVYCDECGEKLNKSHNLQFIPCKGMYSYKK